MKLDPSPFLHREHRTGSFVYHEDARRARDAWEKELSRLTLEKLRYKRLYANAVDLHWRVMQRLGNWGRKHFPWIGSGGWNGIGGGGGGRE